MSIVAIEQRSDEWRRIRGGRVTGSRVSDVLAKLKSGKGEAASRRNYRAQIVAEILTGTWIDSGWCSPEMKWGIENEPLGRAAYEFRTGAMVMQAGFALHPRIERAGASPDGLVGTDGMVEVKCPLTATHLDYILADKVPADYQPQMLWEMACAERQWCDFVSFDPRLPAHLQLFIKRFPLDEKRLAEMEREVVQFLAEVDDILARLPKAPDPLEITDADVAAVAP